MASFFLLVLYCAKYISTWSQNPAAYWGHCKGNRNFVISTGFRSNKALNVLSDRATDWTEFVGGLRPSLLESYTADGMCMLMGSTGLKSQCAQQNHKVLLWHSLLLQKGFQHFPWSILNSHLKKKKRNRKSNN